MSEATKLLRERRRRKHEWLHLHGSLGFSNTVSAAWDGWMILDTSVEFCSLFLAAIFQG